MPEHSVLEHRVAPIPAMPPQSRRTKFGADSIRSHRARTEARHRTAPRLGIEQ